MASNTEKSTLLFPFQGPLSVLFVFVLCFLLEKVFRVKPTTHFSNQMEYLPILTSNIFADLIIIYLTYTRFFYKNAILETWYKKYRISAMVADILIGVLYMLLARYIAYVYKLSLSLTSFAGLSVLVQIVFDFLFYLFFSIVPMGQNDMLDFFKMYAKSVKQNAVFGDSFLVVIAVMISGVLNARGFDFNIVALILSVYLAPYFLYMRD
jgi:uncharacterized protein YacL